MGDEVELTRGQVLDVVRIVRGWEEAGGLGGPEAWWALAAISDVLAQRLVHDERFSVEERDGGWFVQLHPIADWVGPFPDRDRAENVLSCLQSQTV